MCRVWMCRGVKGVEVSRGELREGGEVEKRCGDLQIGGAAVCGMDVLETVVLVNGTASGLVYEKWDAPRARAPWRQSSFPLRNTVSPVPWPLHACNHIPVHCRGVLQGLEQMGGGERWILGLSWLGRLHSANFGQALIISDNLVLCTQSLFSSAFLV